VSVIHAAIFDKLSFYCSPSAQFFRLFIGNRFVIDFGDVFKSSGNKKPCFAAAAIFAVKTYG
jgi:hypothetical protein